MTVRQLTASRLRGFLQYDPDTGAFTWMRNVSIGKKAGDAAGGMTAERYIAISFENRTYKAHRLAWLYMTGDWPVGDIDHINGVRSDNRWRNLRDVPRSINVQNQRRAQVHNRAGLLGVQKRSPGRYRARIIKGGCAHDLGTFDTPEKAHAAYLAAKRRLHEGCMI